jgi:hypothetical protein
MRTKFHKVWFMTSKVAGGVHIQTQTHTHTQTHTARRANQLNFLLYFKIKNVGSKQKLSSLNDIKI